MIFFIYYFESKLHLVKNICISLFVKNGYINDYDGSTYLPLIPIIENNVGGILKYFIRKYLIKVKNKISDDYDGKY